MSEAPNPAPEGQTPAPAAPAPTPTPSDWTSSLSDDMKGYVQNKGFKDAGMVLESYRNFEKLQGVPQERLLKLPENLDISTPEGRAIFERLGAPKDAKGYQIEVPKEGGDEKLAEAFKEFAFKNGLTQKQAEGIVKGWNELHASKAQAQVEAMVAKSNDQQVALKKEWGAAHDQNINIAKAATRNLGLSQEQVDALESSIGFDGTMKLLHKFGSATGEHGYVPGSPAGGGILPPAAAQARIKDLQKDPGFAKKLMDKDSEATRQWNDLHKMAFPGETSI